MQYCMSAERSRPFRKRRTRSRATDETIVASHSEEMDADAVARAIAREGAAANAQPLFRKLASGEPIVLGVFGASVAQNAGCLAQGNRRCMRYSGIQTTALPWGNPYVRPFKGWAVRLLDHINATYPHPSHRINNSGLDATPAAVALDCLFSYLPSMMDIAILEFGSMAMWNSHSLWSIEAIVRHFMALPSPPMLVLLSVHNWCNGVRETVHTQDGLQYKSYWDTVEKETFRVCEQYGAACISQRSSLLPLIRAGQFNVSDFVRDDPIFHDCLHVINAPWGVASITSMLTGWFDGARRQFGAGSASPATTRRVLPSPLWQRNENATISRCYAFSFNDARWIRPLGLRTRPVRWTTWWNRNHTRIAPLNSSLFCPPTIHRDEDAFNQLMASPPRHFFYCHVALAPTARARKQSFGVTALVPGAALSFGEHVAGGHRHLRVKLTYLVSYAGMGTVSLHCDRCRCEPFLIDAHRPDLNESVFVTTSFSVVDDLRDGGCEVVLRVLARTTSGGHKFKVRFVTFSGRAAAEIQ